MEREYEWEGKRRRERRTKHKIHEALSKPSDVLNGRAGDGEDALDAGEEGVEDAFEDVEDGLEEVLD